MRTTLLILVLVLVSAITFAGKTITDTSNTLLGEYTITPVSENTYQLSYSNGDASFTIEVCKGKKECCYLLRGNAVEVMYLCNEYGLGMRKMPDNRKNLDTEVYRHLIKPEMFSQQSLLTCNRQSESDALAIIACFFPLVINNDSYGLVFNYTKDNDKEGLSIK
jgi:hypothetical protein